ncbi:MAG: signal recognition particle-docking protein FtsY [Gammaproteobacteria bacterium TMED119]|nr:MAG: signal recognition particle-docking protein FtsY [Gammaproteobacteria bacterium TMED119]RCL46799.1 MAG: signal recognition particle-docking protein FtsY [Candidatus Thioglobus sp.]|tara:strand:- start:2507 stop:3427 length:921 start_codon:yes stop_codon:yes gene_type:complete
MTEKNLFARLRQGLAKTRLQMATDVPAGQSIEDAIENIEDGLLMADVGLDTTAKIMAKFRLTLDLVLKNNQPVVLANILKQTLFELLEPSNKPIILGRTKPFTILIVGVNGAGKTTTIGKLAKRFKANRKSVMLAAGDTFRAAAVEQLTTWGERNDIPVVAQDTGADSASVIYDGLSSATARGIDVFIADTAGRLHTQNDLMAELQKVKRVMQKLASETPHEILLVLDASMGQNALRQAQEFNRTMGVTGLCITKLDGTAKGGVVLAIADQLGLPIRYIGVGESIDDLQVFDAMQFASALAGAEPQ